MIWFWYNADWDYDSRVQSSSRWNKPPVKDYADLDSTDILIEVAWEAVRV